MIDIAKKPNISVGKGCYFEQSCLSLFQTMLFSDASRLAEVEHTDCSFEVTGVHDVID
jgi:hypothetical protein